MNACATIMQEQDRRRAIRLRLAAMTCPEAATLPTGFAALDRALGGGLPRGRIVELFGPTSGKTTLALEIAARVQSRGPVAWIDADRTFDAAYAAKLGVALARLPVVRPESAEQAMEIACRLAASGGLELLVVDSAAALVPGAELDAGIGGSGPSMHSRALASGLRKLATALARAAIPALFLNQVRTRLAASGGISETSAGGPPLKLHAAVRIFLAPAGPRRVRFRVLKNKASAACAEGELEWKPGAGFTESP
jgi:recombination protein RecA